MRHASHRWTQRSLAIVAAGALALSGGAVATAKQDNRRQNPAHNKKQCSAEFRADMKEAQREFQEAMQEARAMRTLWRERADEARAVIADAEREVQDVLDEMAAVDPGSEDYALLAEALADAEDSLAGAQQWLREINRDGREMTREIRAEVKAAKKARQKAYREAEKARKGCARGESPETESPETESPETESPEPGA